MSLDKDAARSWSKERIKTEIDRRHWQIEDKRRAIQEDDEYYASQGYRNATPGWSESRWAEVTELEHEIEFLASLL